MRKKQNKYGKQKRRINIKHVEKLKIHRKYKNNTELSTHFFKRSMLNIPNHQTII